MLSRRAFLAGAAMVPGALWLDRHLARAETGDDVKGAGPRAACALPDDVLARVRRGWDPDRSGQVVMVPHGWNYESGGISHSTPWHYTADVPMLWYGPGFIRARGAVGRLVTSADVAPTVAKLIGFPFSAEGRPMDEAIVANHPKPKLVVVLVWDAGGRYVLDLHPHSWPNLRALIGRGTWFSAANVGSSPSNTAPVHATIGTGTFPRSHGVVDSLIRFPDGVVADAWSRGPGVIRVPALADEYARAKGDAARTAVFGTAAWHLGMVGQGATLPGVPPHIAVSKVSRSSPSGVPRWGLHSRLRTSYRFPTYLNSLPPISEYWETADLADGRNDGTWRGHGIRGLGYGFNTPARVPFQTRAIKELIVREHLGEHDEPDLLFLNYKIIDEIGHLFFADSLEMRDTVTVQDRYLPNLVSFLDRRLPRRWVLCLTADHGHTASPGRTGGMALQESRIEAAIRSRFDADGDGRPLLQPTRPVWLNVNTAELQQDGANLEDLSKFVAGLTESQVAKPGTIHPGQAGQRVFDAVFAGSLLPHLTCGE